MLTISEVNALLKRYVEGQRQDDPNYQVPGALPGSMAPFNRDACCHLLPRCRQSPHAVLCIGLEWPVLAVRCMSLRAVPRMSPLCPEADHARLRAVQVHPMLSSTLAYAERFASVKNPNVTEEIRKCAPCHASACVG